MTSLFAESVVEDTALTWLEALGYAVLRGPDIALKIQILARWSDPDGFLRRSGRPPKVVYYPAEGVLAGRPEK